MIRRVWALLMVAAIALSRDDVTPESSASAAFLGRPEESGRATGTGRDGPRPDVPSAALAEPEGGE